MIITGASQAEGRPEREADEAGVAEPSRTGSTTGTWSGHRV
jgi:hypothetical protein